MAETLVAYFERYEYGCFLWVSGAIVRQFGHEEIDEETRFAIWQFVERQCVNTFRLLEKNKPNEIPDCKWHRKHKANFSDRGLLPSAYGCIVLPSARVHLLESVANYHPSYPCFIGTRVRESSDRRLALPPRLPWLCSWPRPLGNGNFRPPSDANGYPTDCQCPWTRYL